MKADSPQEQKENEWTDLFGNPEAALEELSKRAGPRPSISLLLALWLEWVLQKGGEGVRERLSLLPEAELQELAVAWLKCYLSQPLYLRIHRNPQKASPKGLLNFSFMGRLVLVEQGSGGSRGLEILYPIDHRRLWPEALHLLPAQVFSAPSVERMMTPAIVLASASRLEKIRQRAEVLAALFRKAKGEEGMGVATLVVEIRGGEHPSPTTPHEGNKPSKGKKKRKSLAEQLELFS